MKQRANLRSPLFLQYASRPAEVESENLLLRSEELDNASWSKLNSSINANSIISPNGTLTSDKFIEDNTNNTHRLNQTIFGVSNDTYTFSVYVKKNGRNYFHLSISDALTGQANILVDLENGTFTNGVKTTGSWTNVSGGMENYGNGWYRVHVTGDKNAGTNIIADLELYNNGRTYTGDNTSGIYVWGAMLELGNQVTSYIKTEGTTVTRAATTTAQEEDVTAELRIYNGGGGYDYERTNLLAYSEDTSQWTTGRGTTTSNNITAPNGELVGSLYEKTEDANEGYVYRNLTVSSVGTYSVSVFFKHNNSQYAHFILWDNGSNGARAWFDIQNGVVGTSTTFGSTFTISDLNIENYGNGWYKCSARYVVTGTDTTWQFRVSPSGGNGVTNTDSGAKIYLFGAQIEEGNQATSYIKTEATAVTELAYQTEAPTEATYTLTRTPNNAKATFEVSELVRDYIEQTLENTSGTTWLEVTLSDSIQLPRHYHFLCTEGYIDNTEGLQTYLNAPSNETFMQSNATVLIPEGESLQIPVNAQYNSFYTITTGGVEGSAVYFSNLDDNTTQIEYITVNSTDEVVKLYVDSVVTEEITIQETECSKYANNKLLFVNKYGAKQEFYVNMKSTEKIRVKDDGFSRNVIDYTNLSVTNGLHSYKRRVLESKEMHTLNTPFLDEENVQAFEELLLSEYVWYKKEGGDYIPVIIKDSNMTRKTHLNDKLIQYTIEVESANNLINIQR